MDCCSILLLSAPKLSPMHTNMPMKGCPNSARTTRLAVPRQAATTTDRRRFAAASTIGGFATGCTGDISKSLFHEGAELDDAVVDARGQAEGQSHDGQDRRRVQDPVEEPAEGKSGDEQQGDDEAHAQQRRPPRGVARHLARPALSWPVVPARLSQSQAAPRGSRSTLASGTEGLTAAPVGPGPSTAPQAIYHSVTAGFRAGQDRPTPAGPRAGSGTGSGTGRVGCPAAWRPAACLPRLERSRGTADINSPIAASTHSTEITSHGPRMSESATPPNASS